MTFDSYPVQGTIPSRPLWRAEAWQGTALLVTADRPTRADATRAARLTALQVPRRETGRR